MKAAKLYGLDHLRTLAILLVFIYHYGRLFPSPQWVTDIGKFGWTGVDLFFVLSGYLISSQLFAGIAKDNRIPLRPFFIKRFFRILPAYWLVVALYFFFPALHEREALAPLWKYLTFTQNIGTDLRYHGTFSHAWSLCIEEQFYLLLPLVLLGFLYVKQFKRAWLLLVALFVTGLIIRAWSWYTLYAPFAEENSSWVYWYKWLYYPTWCRLDGLLLGISIAAVFQYKPGIKVKLQPYGNALLVGGAGILTAAYFVCDNERSLLASVIGFPLVSLGYAVVVLGAICSNSILYKWQSAITTKLAALSYAVYLTHKMVIHVVQAYIPLEKDSNAMFVLCTVACLLVGFAMNEIIEKPFLKLRDRVLVS